MMNKLPLVGELGELHSEVNIIQKGVNDSLQL